MNSLSLAADAIVSLLTLAAFVCFFYGPWQLICTDLGRQVIFERRDRLFDMALAGRIDFNSAAYRETRRTMNGMLRFAHKATWLQFLVSATFVIKNKVHVTDTSLDEISPEVRKEIKRLLGECSASLTVMMLLKSIIFCTIIGLLCLVAMCTKDINWLFRCFTLQKKFEHLDV